MQEDKQFAKQLDLFDPEKYPIKVNIIGVGSIGSFTALSLAKLGVKKIRIQDMDKVTEHNQPNQLHGPTSLYERKVTALRAYINDLTGMYCKVSHSPFTKSQSYRQDVMISAVDSMKVRKMVWESVRGDGSTRLFLDGRIGGQVIKLYSVNPQDALEAERYERSLHSDKMAVPIPCTQAGVIDVSFNVAALMARAVRQYFVEDKKNFEVIFDQKNLIVLKG